MTLGNPTPEGGSTPVLQQQHVDILTARSIAIEVAQQAGLRSIDLGRLKEETRKGAILPWPGLPLHPVTGILIPYLPCMDGIPRCRVRSDVTQYTVPGPVEGSHYGEKSQDVPRYICQAKVGVVPYLTRQALNVANDPKRPVYIVEAPLKALSLVSHGLPAIGLGGVLAGGHDRDALDALNEIVAHSELRQLRWKGRKVFVVFDAGMSEHDDHPGNPMVALGAAYVAKALADLGADVRVVTVPYYHPETSEPELGRIWRAEDQGPDDFIARKGIRAFKNELKRTIPGDPLTRVAEALAAAPDGSKARAVAELVREPFFTASLHVGGDLAVTAVAGVTKKSAEIGKANLQGIVKAFKERLAVRAKKNDPEWMRQLETSRTGVVRPIRENVELCLRNDDGVKGLVAFDEFAEAVVFLRPPPWLDKYAGGKTTIAGGQWTDVDDLRLGGYLSEKHRLIDVPEAKVRAAVTLVARDHPVHPVRAYLNRVVWDGEPRLSSWLYTHFGVAASEYASKVGTWWLISAVARVMRPGCKVDHTLVLEGEQGLAKSSALRVLGGEWFSDADLGDLRSKEAALSLAGVWIVELAEGEIFSRASTRALKAFVTKEFDDIIPKFSNRRSRMQRQTVFALTINDEADYLTDSTGNRRWWPVRCTRIDLEGLREVRDQLWAEAVVRFRAGEVWWPANEDEKALCVVEQREREAGDPWDDPIREALHGVKEHTTISDLLSDPLSIPIPQQGRRERLRVSACLRRLGWIEVGKSGDVRRWGRGASAASAASAAPARTAGLAKAAEGQPLLRLVPSGDDWDEIGQFLSSL